MYTFKIKFRVDGRQTEQIVRAQSKFDAEKLIKAQYPNSKISFIATVKI